MIGAAAATSACPGSIDWTRMACPQSDGYDTEIILRLAPEQPGRGDSGAALPGESADTESPSVAGGAVAVGVVGPPLMPPPRFAPVAGLPAALEEAVDLVGRWPAAAAQWPRIVTRIQPFADTELAAASAASPRRLGSASHNESSRFGVIGLTVHCALGTAQAIVHETAHHKLRAIGVDNEAATRLVLNHPEETFPSPVVGRPRPMTAVLHAHYSFMHVLQLDLCMLERETDAERLSDLRILLGRNAPRIAEMTATIRQSAQLDRDGEAFVAALLDWADEALSEARRWL